jgi:hypothetical protein
VEVCAVVVGEKKKMERLPSKYDNKNIKERRKVNPVTSSTLKIIDELAPINESVSKRVC